MTLCKELSQLRTEHAVLAAQIVALARIAELEQQRHDLSPFVKPNRPKADEPKRSRKKRAPEQNLGRRCDLPTHTETYALDHSLVPRVPVRRIQANLCTLHQVRISAGEIVEPLHQMRRSLQGDDVTRTAHTMRAAPIQSGGFIAVARNPVLASYVREHEALGAMFLASALGEAMMTAEPRGGAAVIEAITSTLRGHILGSGVMYRGELQPRSLCGSYRGCMLCTPREWLWDGRGRNELWG